MFILQDSAWPDEPPWGRRLSQGTSLLGTSLPVLPILGRGVLDQGKARKKAAFGSLAQLFGHPLWRIHVELSAGSAE